GKLQRRLRVRQVEYRQHALRVAFPHEGEDGFGRIEKVDAAVYQCGLFATPAKKLPGGVEHRSGIGRLRFDAARAVRLGYRQPRLRGREAAVLAVAPRHRRAAAVAALEVGPERD